MNNVKRGILLSPLDCTHGQTTSGVASNNSSWTTQTVGRGEAWHNIKAFGMHKWSNDFGQGMPSWP